MRPVDRTNLFSVRPASEDGKHYRHVLIECPPSYGRKLSGRDAANLAAWLLVCVDPKDVSTEEMRDLLEAVGLGMVTRPSVT